MCVSGTFGPFYGFTAFPNDQLGHARDDCSEAWFTDATCQPAARQASASTLLPFAHHAR